MVNFCWELTDYGKRTRSPAVAGFSSTPYPPATQKENIRKGSLTRVFRLHYFFMNQRLPRTLVYLGAHFEFLQKFAEIFEYKG
jgi:hypothetical protein